MPRLALIFERQWLHAVLLAALLVPVVLVSRAAACQPGELWGIRTPTWFWLAVIIPIAHQVYVWLCWRTQLHVGLLTRALGSNGFTLYSFGFSIFGISRLVSVFLLAFANPGTLPIQSTVLQALAVLTAIPAIYLFYSVARYFGFHRAMGADHFDSTYRTKPFVSQGIFRFTKNGMYVYGFLMLWVPGLWWASAGALVAAAFSHAYIWVHYFATELPDIRRIYGPRQAKP